MSYPVVDLDVNTIKEKVAILLSNFQERESVRQQWMDVFSLIQEDKDDELRALMTDHRFSFVIDFAEFYDYLLDHHLEFHNQQVQIPMQLILLLRPEYVIGEFEFYLKVIFESIYHYYPQCGPYLRFSGNVREKSMMHLLQESHLLYGELYKFDGLIIAVSQPASIAIERVFKCSKCGNELRIDQPEGIVSPPIDCPNCNNAKFKHIDLFDKQQLIQYMTVQQLPDEVKGSSEAYKLNIELYDDLISDISIRPGDHVVVSGYLKRVYEITRIGKRPKYRYYFKCLYITRKRQDADETTITDERRHELLSDIFYHRFTSFLDDIDKQRIRIKSDKTISDEERTQQLLKLATGLPHAITNDFYIFHDKRQKHAAHQIFSDDAFPSSFDMISTIRDSIAPNLVGDQYKSMKLGIASSLFTRRSPLSIEMHKIDDSDDLSARKYKIRDVSHVLVIGDAATGKLEMIKYLKLVCPHLLTTNGPSLTGKGITVGLSSKKDFDTGERMMHIGAYIIADGGTLIIDEFDKTPKEYYADLLQPMESLMVEKDVTGFGFQKFNARTGLLAFGNPNKGRWDKSLDLNKNFYIPNYLWSRFDLVFALVDQYSEKTDTLIANFRGNIRYQRRLPEEFEPIFSADWLRDYIIYTQQEIDPQLTPETIEYLTEQYRDIRQKYNPEKLAEERFHTTGRVSEASGSSVTPRNLEGFYRLSVALARMDHSSIVKVKHAKLAVNLYEEAIRSINRAVGKGDIIDPGYMTSGEGSVREKNPWRNAKERESDRVRTFLHHLFIEQRSDPIDEKELEEILINEVFMYSQNATKHKAETTAKKAIEYYRNRGKLLDERGDGSLRYHP